MKHEALNKEFFQGNEEMYEIYDNILKVCKDHCSKDLEKRLSHLTKDQAEVIKMCLRLDPKNRAGVQQLLSSKLFAKIRNTHLETKVVHEFQVKIDSYQYDTEEAATDLSVNQLKKYIIKYATKIKNKDV